MQHTLVQHLSAETLLVSFINYTQMQHQSAETLEGEHHRTMD
jgi:hypothetical protein